MFYKKYHLFVINLILFLLVSEHVTAQDNLTKYIMNNIQVGYTTRWDINNLFNMSGKYEPADVYNPDSKTSTFRQTAIKFDSLGLTFLCDLDGEIISGILFQDNFKGDFGFDMSITIGETNLNSIIKHIDIKNVTTCKASIYWYFAYKDFLFYFKKKNNHLNIDKLPVFTECFKEYLNTPIAFVSLNFPNSYIYSYDYKIFGYAYCKPLYSPKNETHKNCIKLGWPNSLPFFLIPIYAITGGAKKEKNKEGYWKEYDPNHKLRSEGNYTDNKKNGVFKYYDYNGNFIGSERHFAFLWYWKWIILLSILGLLIYFKSLRNKQS